MASYHFARHYFGNLVWFLLLQLLRCFTSLRSLLYTIYSYISDWAFTPARLPHSDMFVSSDICSFTNLFAAYHVLLRLLVPSHPPFALITLTFFLLLVRLNLQKSFLSFRLVFLSLLLNLNNFFGESFFLFSILFSLCFLIDILN